MSTLALILALAQQTSVPPTYEPRLLVTTAQNGVAGETVALPLSAAGTATPLPLALSPESIARTFGDRHWIVDRDLGRLSVVSARDGALLATHDLGAGVEPVDVIVIGPRRVYVSDRAGSALLRLDPTTGSVTPVVDLAPLADADGNPDMARMERDGARLFVQLQRLDANQVDVAPAQLAVVDWTSETLLDVDPGQAGVQGIELFGRKPAHAFVIDRAARRLFVSAAGELHTTGGLELVDLDALSSLGFILSERELGHLSAFVIVSPELAYVVGHTDFAFSSHLWAFSPRTGQFISEHHVSFGGVDSLAYDRGTGLLFWPEPANFGGGAHGIHVFDAATGTRLTADPIATGLAPIDVHVARPAPLSAREPR